MSATGVLKVGFCRSLILPAFSTDNYTNRVLQSIMNINDFFDEDTFSIEHARPNKETEIL